MNCPNCGQTEQARVKVCPGCGAVYASEDLQIMRQLEYLLTETAAWDGVEALRSPYNDKLERLKARLVSPEPAAAAHEVPLGGGEPVAAAPAMPEPAPASAASKEPPPIQAVPKEKVPFDEWLLSERNIKFALYGGGLLLFIAGIIFVGVNWSRIPGPIKFAITMMITGLTFLSGYLLFQRQSFRLGGTALLGLGCGFLALNFAVLQNYVMGPQGFRGDVMWLIASPICLLIYFLIGFLTRQELFGWISIAALASLFAAALVVSAAPVMIIVLVFVLFALLLLGLALLLKESSLANFTYRPLLFAAQGGMPLAVIFALLMWVDYSNCIRCTEGSPWIALIALLIAVSFYAITDFSLKWLWSRWAAAALLSLTAVLALIQSGIDNTIAGLLLIFLALAEMGAGWWLKKREGRLMGALPFHVMAAALALLVTVMAATAGDMDSLIKVLFADVLLLGVAAWIFQDYRWVFGAVWLFMLPVYLLLDLFVHEYPYQGLLMGLLGLNYVAAGYVLGRRDKLLGWPFLSAAVFLSLLAPALSWSEPWVLALITAVIAIIYGLVAVWLDWNWLLLPALFALDLAILGINRAAYPLRTPVEPALAVSYIFSGSALLLIGLALRRARQSPWAWPVYLFGAVDLALAYAAGLIIGGWFVVGMSAVLALFLFAFAWLERDLFSQAKLPQLLSYLGTAVVFAGFIYLLPLIGGLSALDYWPAYTAALCAVFMGLAWLIRRDPLAPIYGLPLRYASLVLTAIPLTGALVILDPVLAAITFAIAALIYAFDSVLSRKLQMAYMAAGAFVIVIWAVLFALEVSELLTYMAPLALGLLGLGWNERRLGRTTAYVIPTMLGLVLLLGTTFAQSIIYAGRFYAWLLLLESAAALAWGAAWRVRCYIQAAGIALLANALVQLGPGFVELSRWVQIALTGGLLLGVGLLALFRREAILAARQKVAGEWREFGP